MNLNLDNARLSREIEENIKAELRRLPATEQKFVLERVAVDVLAGLSRPSDPPATTRARQHAAAPALVVPPAPASPPAPAPGATGKQWEAILAYCRANPTPDGTFHNTDIATAIFPPEKMKTSRNVALSTVFTATKRRSIDDSNDPYFVMLGKGKFRLATADERAKAKGVQH